MAAKATRQLSGLGTALRQSPATERLLGEVRNYALARGTGLVQGVTDKVGSATQKLEDHADNPGALGVGVKKLAEGKSPLSAGMSSLGAGVKDKVKSIFGKGGSSGPKMTNIIEDIDVGAPVSDVYDQWTQFQEFSSFMKGVEAVDQKDEVESSWRGKVWWSRRTWKARVTEQIPDRKIAWTSEGAKGTTKGVVTFHPLADDLTKVLLVMEYSPGGFVEKTANLWRAFGRRVRLDLKHFRRFVTMQGEPTGSWRGEILDGEVTRQPEDVEADEDRDEGDDYDDDVQDEDENLDDEPEDDVAEDDDADEDEEADEDSEPSDDEDEQPAAEQDNGDAPAEERRSRPRKRSATRRRANASR